MIIVCPSCSARFQYADSRFQGAISKRFQCPKCATMFEVMNPLTSEATPPPMEAPTPLPPAPKPTETTSRRLRDAMLASSGETAMPPGIRYSLAFLTGPQASTVRALTAPVTTLGREEGDVIINDPETSRKHARLEIHADGTAWLTDLGSTNGTVTGGKAIDGPTQLLDRQEFSCGRSTFMLLIRALDSSSTD
ncbi:MAG: FHA domain-containing protein [Holophaga sp.]|nr:FHA domain-containing protein [Holophaga sp.]